MTTTSAIQRQPTKLDYASPTQFKFQITKLPKVEYFCTAVNVPGIELGGIINQPTPLKDIPLPGEKLTYSDLTMTFLIDENLENYREIHGWMTGLGFPKDRNQYRTLVDAATDRFPTTGSGADLTDAGRVKYGAVPQGPVYSDATLNILTSKNTPNIEVRYSDVFPVSLSSLDFTQQALDIEYLTASATFRYKIYEFAVKGSATTTETTS
jgi:hypothetical protein